GLGLIIWLGRRSVVRLTSPLRVLQDAVEARLAGDTTVRAPEDQGYREAGLQASVLNQTYDANDSLMDQQDRAITAHQLTDRVSHELAEMNAGSAGWRRALETIVSSFQLAGIEVWDTVGDEEPRLVQRFPDDPGTA